MGDEIGRPELAVLMVPAGDWPEQRRAGVTRRTRQDDQDDQVDQGGRGARSAPSLYVDTDRGASFDDVFRRDFVLVARTAYLMLGSTGEAEEVAQEAFTELLRRWDGIDNPSGFVRTTALNRCRDIGRRRRTTDRVLRRIRPVDAIAAEDTPGGWEVIEALSVLELPLREVVVLRFYLDHTIDEIAELTDAPAGTVKSRLHRAMGQLSLALRPT